MNIYIINNDGFLINPFLFSNTFYKTTQPILLYLSILETALLQENIYTVCSF